jgi:MFS family permease
VPRAPSILLLQACIFQVAFALHLTLSLAARWWGGERWTANAVGFGMMGAMACYVASTVLGGRLADRWGRARTAVLGNGLSLAGCALALAALSAGSGAGVAMAATCLIVAGCSMFFPGCAGLFSDAEAAAGAMPMALHVKISRYNLGWSSGAFVGFGAALLISTLPMTVGYLLMVAALIGSASQMRRFWSLPPRPPSAIGDRSPHPSIPWLMVMYRLNAVLGAGIGMSLIGMLDQVLREHLGGDEAVRVSRLMLTGYAGSYVVMFILLGMWSGWILRPWRALALQSGLVLGPALLAVLGWAHHLHPVALAATGCIIGLSFGAAFTASLYYSLRSPDRASRAASLHEASVGTGNIVGPLIGTMAISAFGPTLGIDRLTSLALGCTIMAFIGLALQLALIPRAMRAR